MQNLPDTVVMSSLTDLTKHMRAEHSDKGVKCDLCTRTFFLKRGLRYHRKLHCLQTWWSGEQFEWSWSNSQQFRPEPIIESRSKHNLFYPSPEQDINASKELISQLVHFEYVELIWNTWKLWVCFCSYSTPLTPSYPPLPFPLHFKVIALYSTD